MKTKKLTIKYWNELSESSKIRAFKITFPLFSDSVIKDYANIKIDSKYIKNDFMFQQLFKSVRIPIDSYYKLVKDKTYFN